MRREIIEAVTETVLAKLTRDAEFEEIGPGVPERDEVRDKVESTAQELLEHNSIGVTGEIDHAVYYALQAFHERGLVYTTLHEGSFELSESGRRQLRESPQG